MLLEVTLNVTPPMVRKAATAVLALLLAAALGGCHSGGSAPDVMAKVNGKKILRSQVDKYYSNKTAGSPEKPSEEQASSLRLSRLERTDR